MGQETVDQIDEEGMEVERERGPARWLVPQMMKMYAPLVPRQEAPAEDLEIMAEMGTGFVAPAEAVEEKIDSGPISKTIWRDRLLEYKSRQVQAAALREAAATGFAAAPVVPGTKNWRPLGPTVVRNGQTKGDQPVAGRIIGLAVAPGGKLVFAASAVGGVFRSDDAGLNWKSIMDGFDLDSEEPASTSLACGAIAIDPADPQRIYVGTGEGDTWDLFSRRVTNALPSYRGIGPIRSDDGGTHWHTEPVHPSSTDLAGEAYFALAVDPVDREHVLAATTVGIYKREPAGYGRYVWTRRHTDIHSDVVVAMSGNTRRFFAAKWGTGIYHSVNGVRWYKTGTGFPQTGFERIAIGVQPNNPDIIYALAVDDNGLVFGLYRLDGVSNQWNEVTSVPNILPPYKGRSQGNYDLTIAVDPNDIDIVYLGGSYTGDGGSIWRCRVQAVSGGYKIVNAASIGEHAHADIHKLVHSPGNSNELWCGCDGGVFLNPDPAGSGTFESRNQGLSCLHSNFLAQHPTDPNILYVGLQDNGTARTSSPPVWDHIADGDGGYCLINWDDPNKAMVFQNGWVKYTTDGWSTHKFKNFGWHTMTMPIVGLPLDKNPANAWKAEVIAVGAGSRVEVTEDFAGSWPEKKYFAIGDDRVFALAFASRDRLFIGTTKGKVFQADRTGGSWTEKRLDDAFTKPLGLRGWISDIAVDWSDSSLQSIYVVFAGMGDGDMQHVWHYDGTGWDARSGTGDTGLIDVEHNALVVDPDDPQHLYVGANIGVWHSPNAGEHWYLMQNGLPDAPVFDLKIHPTHRLLRASTHGRGVYELDIS